MSLFYAASLRILMLYVSTCGVCLEERKQLVVLRSKSDFKSVHDVNEWLAIRVNLHLGKPLGCAGSPCMQIWPCSKTGYKFLPFPLVRLHHSRRPEMGLHTVFRLDNVGFG